MTAQKITAKQNGHLPVMGKGNYTPVQTNKKIMAENSLLPTFTNLQGIVQLATNYL
jgi:hypothetical protein